MSVDVTYNGFDIPQTFGPFFFSNSYEGVEFRCNCLVSAGTSGALITACNDFESKLRADLKKLTVDFGGGNEYTFDHSDNSVLNPVVSVNVIDDGNLNTETTRAYKFFFRGELQADLSGFDFRRWSRSSFDIRKDEANRRVVTVNLEYTASKTPAKTSLENWDSFALSHAQSILTDIGGKYDRMEETKRTDDQKKITSGRFVFQEILDDELDGTTNDSRLQDVKVQYSVDKDQTVGVSNAGFVQIPQVHVDVSYYAKIDSEVQSDGTNLQDIYRDEVKPWIIKHSFDVLELGDIDQAGSLYITNEDFENIDPTEFSIRGRLSFTVPRVDTDIFFLREEIEEVFDSGDAFKKLWDGKPNTYSQWQMGSTRNLTRRITVHKYGSPPGRPPALGGNFFLRRFRKSNVVSQRGTGSDEDSPDLTEIEVHEVTFTENYLFIDFAESISLISGGDASFVGGD